MTNKLRCVAVDDELAFLKTIKNIIHLKENAPVELVGVARSVKDAIEIIKSTKPDLVFLDIKLPDGSGFNVLEAFSELDFKVVFITAYNEYAIKAFRYSALDYLLKPIHSELFWEVIGKALDTISKNDIQLQMEVLARHLESKKTPADKILLKEGENIHFVKTRDITYCEAQGSYTRFHLLNEPSIFVCHHLKDYEEILAENGFVRTHRSFLVNKSLIKRFDKADGGLIVLENNETVPVSFRRKEHIIKALTS